MRNEIQSLMKQFWKKQFRCKGIASNLFQNSSVRIVVFFEPTEIWLKESNT